MDTGGYFADGVETRNIRFTPLVDHKTTHHMMHRGRYLHHLFAYIHAYSHMFGKDIWNNPFSFTVFPMGNIQIDRSMICTSAFLDFLKNCSCHFIAASQLETFRLVALHEALT